MTGRAGRSVVLVGALALVVVAVLGWTRTPGSVAERDRVRDAAADFATGMMSYDHDDLDGLRQRVADGATDAFADVVGTTLEDGLADRITGLGASSTATVHRVLVDTPTDGTAHAVVVLDVTITSDEGARELTDAYVELTLVRRGGRWLVDDLTRLAAAGDELTPAGGG